MKEMQNDINNGPTHIIIVSPVNLPKPQIPIHNMSHSQMIFLKPQGLNAELRTLITFIV